MSKYLSGIAALALIGAAAFALPARAAEQDTPPRQKWSFSGPFGTFDRAQLQRMD